MTDTCAFCNATVEHRAEQCSACGALMEPTFAAGERIGGRYQLIELIGQGPLGATYRARDVSLGVEVALKIVSAELVPDANERVVFVSRVEMFASRTIAGCAMPLAVGADDRVAFVSSPLVDGVSLRTVLGARAAARRPLAPEESLRLMLSLAASTSALHSATPHGSLRPENVMVTARGLILTDCAIAGAIPPERFQPRVQQFARAVPFVSPEAMRGRKLTAVADLYALGAIAAELLAGSPSPRALEGSALPPDVDATLRALLDRDASRRPAAVGTLLDALSRACGFERRPLDVPLPVPEAPPPRAAIASRPPSAPPPSSPPRPSIPRPPAPVRYTDVSDDDPTLSGRLAPATVTAQRPEPPRSVPPQAAPIPLVPSDRPRMPALPGTPARSVPPPPPPGSVRPTSRPPVPMPPMPLPATSAHGVLRTLPLPRDWSPASAGPSIPGRVGPGPMSAPVPRGPGRSGPPSMPRVPLPSMSPHPPSRGPVPGQGAAGRGPLPAMPSIPRGPAPATVPPWSPAAPRALPPDEARSSDGERQRDLEGIDPRLLRAARRLEAERLKDEEIDAAELEIVEDPHK